MKKSFSLKDALFNERKVTYLSQLLSSAYPQFKSKAFIKETVKAFPELELKERIVWIAQMLEKYLPADYEQAIAIIVQALPPSLDPTKTDDDYGDFIFAPFGEYVVRNGLKREYLSLSLQTLKEITQRFSMEDAIRAFLNTFEKETFATLKKWVKHDHYHVRRLCSEGTRPLLPWSKRIALSSTKAIELLDVLYKDKTRYVTRSVANHLNDITKTDPALVLATLSRWEQERKQNEKELQWMMRHSLRTLIKRGNKDAFVLLGHSSEPEVVVKRFSLNAASRKIAEGEVLTFTCEVYALKDEHVVLDYSIDFVKANGATKGKTFKIKKLNLKKGEVVSVQKNHRFVKDATTFTLYPGVHTLTLLINGTPQGSKQFIIQ